MCSDLSSLFLPNPDGPAQPAQFRQAVLVEFDADDGTNVVQIGTTQVPNLPLAVTGAEIGLETGDNIIVMYLGTSAMIWCKIATPGSANYGASNNGRAGFVDNASNWAVTTAGTTVITDSSIMAPGWANSAIVTALGAASTHNSGASTTVDNWGSQVSIARPGQTPAFSALISQVVAGAQIGSTYALFADTIPVVPGSPLTCNYTVFSGGTTWTARSDNIATLFVAAQFFRESVT